MKVIATARGYFDQIREPGDEFEVPDDTKEATWFEPVDKPATKKSTKKVDEKKADETKTDDLA